MKQALCVAIALMGLGCFRSPLFFHEERRATQTLQADAGVCPLYFPKADLCALIEWPKAPAVKRFAEAKIKFWSKTHSSSQGPYRQPDLEVGFDPIMPDMAGHGTAPVDIEPEKAQDAGSLPGQFVVKKIWFMMGGRWEIRLQLKRGDEIVEQASTEIFLK